MLSIGLMSSASMDGIEVVLLDTDGEGQFINLGHFKLNYTSETRLLLKAAEQAMKTAQGDLSMAANLYSDSLRDCLCQESYRGQGNLETVNTKEEFLDSEVSRLTKFLANATNSSDSLNLERVIQHSTQLFAMAIKELLKAKGKHAYEIDVIGLQGQTLLHHQGLRVTVQIVDGQQLAALTGITVVNDFCSRDVADRVPVTPLTMGVATELDWNGEMSATIFAYFAVRSLKNLPLKLPGTTQVPKTLLSNGHAHVPEEGPTSEVEVLISRNPAVLRGYAPSGSAEVEVLIQKHRATRVPPERLMTTESAHPLTLNLSHLAKTDLPAAYDVLRTVDQQALDRLKPYGDIINQLARTFADVLGTGHSIKMGGCGAAARAATAAECLFRKSFPDLCERVTAINAGGDLVIVRAAEGFEDRNDYGKLQLEESGWENGDLLVGVSASGAAGFVSGQIDHVLDSSSQRRPILLVCNTFDECLTRFADDEKTIFHRNKRDRLKQVDVLDICVGEMGLSGSTRMQAATVQLLVLSFALLQAGQSLRKEKPLDFNSYLSTLQSSLSSMPIQELSALTGFEVEAYKAQNYVTYTTSPENALTVATDTTERSPTFNWDYFENDEDEKKSPSRSRIIIKGYTDNEQALQAMLGRELRTLDWIGEQSKPKDRKTTLHYLLGYDLTEGIVEKRKHYMPKANRNSIDIVMKDDSIEISFSGQTISIPLQKDLPPTLKPLYQQLMLKLILNTHSTLVAGQLGCYQGNLMTSVRASNQKLINRAIALSNQVIRSSFFQRRLPPPEAIQHRITHAEITEMLYRMMLVYRPGDSIVFNTANSVLLNYETLCYNLLLSCHLKSPVLATTRSPINEVALLTDIELAETITEGKKSVICIEGGGTYFRFSVVTPDNQSLELKLAGHSANTIKVPGGNCNVIGWDTFIKHLDDACQVIRIGDLDLMSFMQQEQPLIIIGMAGMAAEANRLKLVAHFIDRTRIQPKHILITSDADTYLAALPGFGAVLIAGTGSICLGLTPQGNRIQAGGLGGQFSGDPGSAFSVGRNALLACLQLRNGGVVWSESDRQFIQKDDPLFLSIKQKTENLFGISFENQAVGYFNREHIQRARLAELSPLVFEHAFERTPSSPLAKNIIFETASDLAKQLGETMEGIFRQEQNKRNCPFPVILIGGLFDSPHHHHLVKLIEQAVHTMHPKVKIDWQHEPAENYVSRVVQQATAPAPVYRFGNSL